jgi:pyruvyl transferase EpsI
MKRIKTGLKKVYLIYKKWVFLFSDNYKRIKQDKHKRKLILIDTPAHGNLGDQAIALAEQKFIREMLGLDFYELTKEDYLVGKKALSKVIRREDMLLIHGGGFLGTLWQNEEDIFLSILKEFSSNKIVVFPQTVFFEDSDHGRLERERMEKIKYFT